MSYDATLAVTFWLLLAVWPMTYIFYPVLLIALARVRGSPELEADLPWPTVSIVIAAHNEQATIERCVRSCLAQRYSGEPVSVVVGLDGCTDDTAAILSQIDDPRLRVMAFGRQGKAATHNALIPASNADVVATTDAGAEMMAGTLDALIAPFRSSRVGCAGGRFVPRSAVGGQPAAEASYFAWEYRLMRAESELGILAKGSGMVQAFRRSLWRPIPLTSDADISLPCLIAEQGHLVAFVPGAIVSDDGPRDLGTVFRARRRMTTQTLTNVPGHIVDLARRGYWGHATSLTLHKFLRWMAPIAAIGSGLVALVLGLTGHWEYAVIQGSIALGGLIALGTLSILRGNGLSVMNAFLVSQIAFVAGTADCLRGSRVTRWER